tara:strand:- start:6 stop:1031 length:1026 start_codon:yes stop_codon:yes gene_type:complete
MRDDFTSSTKDVLAKRVGFHCSNPNCRTLTCGPRTEANKFVSIGVAAHISAASPNGPRSNKHLTSEQKSSVRNGIWLCQNCAKLIDNDPLKYPEDVLTSWKRDAELFASNKIAQKTAEIIHDPQLLEQLSTFARVEFNYRIPFDHDQDGVSETYIKDAVQIVYTMISCAYLQTSKYLRRDKFVFSLSLSFDFEEGVTHFYGELITHLTPFGYYFGVLAQMLNKGQIDELADYLNSFPRIIISRQAALGTFVPYKISRINPSKIRMECNPRKFIFKKGLITTSDLLIFLSHSTRKGITVIDDVNDAESLTKLMKLYEKIEDGFDMTEVSIDIDNPEEWYVHD